MAEKIYDIESYYRTTGAKRFKRTQKETQLGLSPEEALQRRLEQIKNNPGQHPPIARKGNMTIKIKPQAGVDFEHANQGELEVTMNQQWYNWLEEKLDTPYHGDLQRLIKHILHLGIGELVTRISFPRDFENPLNAFLDKP